jgi:redox-sensitive bicupin YhaK (pirin superfamily)
VVIPAGGVQLISAGTGLQHSEYNPSSDDEVHFLQIWIHPEQKNLKPGYQFAEFDLWSELDHLIPLANRNGSNGAVTIHQDVSIDYLSLSRGGRLEKEFPADRYVWVQVTVGVVDVCGETLRAGDGLAISDVPDINFSSAGGGELLLFVLA